MFEKSNRQDGWTLRWDCFFKKSWPFIFMLSKHDSSTFTNILKRIFLSDGQLDKTNTFSLLHGGVAARHYLKA